MAQETFDRQGLVTHLGARLAPVGPGRVRTGRVRVVQPSRPEVAQGQGRVHAVKPGRALPVCQLEVYGVRPDGSRKLVAPGRQTIIRVDRRGE